MINGGEETAWWQGGFFVANLSLARLPCGKVSGN